MRKYLIFVLLACWNQGLMAQEYWDGQRPDHMFTFGVRAGINFAKQYNTGDGADNDFRVGFRAGMEADLNVVRSFSVNTGVYFTQKGYKSDYSDYRGKRTITDNVAYIEIPVLASYRVKLSDAAQFQLNVGPYVAFGVSGKKKLESTFSGETGYSIDSFDEYDGMKKQDAGLHAGTAVTFDNLYFGVCYERSLMNVSNATAAKMQNGCIAVTIGYNL